MAILSVRLLNAMIKQSLGVIYVSDSAAKTIVMKEPTSGIIGKFFIDYFQAKTI